MASEELLTIFKFGIRTLFVAAHQLIRLKTSASLQNEELDIKFYYILQFLKNTDNNTEIHFIESFSNKKNGEKTTKCEKMNRMMLYTKSH